MWTEAPPQKSYMNIASIDFVQKSETRCSLQPRHWVGFSGELIWPLGQISLLVKISDGEHSTSAWMNFMVVWSPSPYNGIIGRPRVRKIWAIPSTAHGMLKFPVAGGTVTLRSSKIIPLECAMVLGPGMPQPAINQVTEERIQVAIHPEYPEQNVAIGSTLTEGRKELCGFLRRNLDIFAWKPTDMTKIPRHIAEHRLNIHERCLPIRQKKRGQAPERNKAICEEVEKLVDADIMKEVHYHRWLSNPVMTTEAEIAFKQMKELIAELPMLTAPKEKKELIIYLAASKEAISAVLITERDRKQMPIYFVSRALQGPKVNYALMEKLILALVSAYFIVERPEDNHQDTLMDDKEELSDPWILFTGGSSCIDGSGAGLINTNPKGMKFTYDLRFMFNATNNEAEYEALIAGKDCAKITKKQSKPDKIEHEISKNAQKPDQRTFSVQWMRTRSKSYPINSNATIPRRSNRIRVPNIVEPEIRTIEEIVPMADRTMEELLQAPTEGYGEAIVIPKILAENFEIKTNLLQLVQANKFHGFKRNNPHTHISNFKRMTATFKYRDVPNDAIKLMLFPYSLEGAAMIWYEKEPPNSILTWDDLVNKFVNQFFPPSKTTHLKNEISRFTQRFKETFGEVWDCFKEMLRACPHHGFSELTSIDMFYNGLNEQDQDSLNAAAGGNLLNKTTREAFKIIKNKSEVRYSRSKSNVSMVNTNSRDNVCKSDDRIDKLADQNLKLVEIVNKQVITPASAKAVEKTCVICRGVHAYYDCIVADSNQPSVCAATGSYNQVSTPNRASHQIPPPGFAPVQNNPNSFFQNQALTSGTLSSNNVPNPKGEMKAVTTRSGLAYEGPSITTNSPLEKLCGRSSFDAQFASTYKSLLTNKDKLFELAKFPLNENCSAMLLKKLPEKLGDPGRFLIPCDFPGMDVCHTLADLGASINLMTFSIWKKLLLPELTPTRMTLELADRSITHPKGVAKDVFVKKFHFPTDFVVVDFEVDPRVPLILGRSFLRTDHALINVYREEITLRYNSKSSNPALISNPLITESDFCKEPIVKSSSPTLTSFGESDFFLEEIEFFLNDESIPTGIDNSFYDQQGDILFLEKLLNEDPFQLPPMDLKQAEETKAKSSIEEPPELELKELSSHLEYTFLEESEKLPVIIAKDLKDVEKEALIKVLKSHKQAISWKISDIKGIDPRFCTHKILMEEDYKPEVQSQRRVNPKIYDVITKEVIKLLDVGMIYPTSDSPWVSPIHCMPKKGGMTIVANENNELIPMRLVTDWRVCIDYRKLNDATRKDHFLLPFMDQMLERLAENKFYFFLDGFSGYFQIPIDPQDQEKTTFTCPFGTFAYRRMPFDLCNAPGMFQRCMIAIFHDMIEKKMEVFMDDFSVIGDSFSSCLTNLDKMLKRCEETDLVLNWEKCHFMCREGIVLGHKISKSGIKVDRAKVEVIVKLPHPTTVKGVRSFLGHAADHLSRLENPRKDVLENKDINENFLLETLRSLSGDSTPWAIISDRGTHFCNDQFTRVMIKYGVTHQLAAAYHPQTSGQVEAYENSVIYKERTKKLHDFKIKNRIFNVGDQVLLFNSRLKIFSGKLKNHWSGPFTITQVFPYGTVELSQPNGPNFKVNGHRVKHYFRGKDCAKITKKHSKLDKIEHEISKNAQKPDQRTFSVQFRYNPFKDWCKKLCNSQCFASVKHPQANGLVERENRSLGEGIKARLDKRSKNWLEEISHVLWAHRTRIKSSNGETPFSLTYGAKAAAIQKARSKAKMEKYYNAKVHNTSFVRETSSTRTMKQAVRKTEASSNQTVRDRMKSRKHWAKEHTSLESATKIPFHEHGTSATLRNAIRMKCLRSREKNTGRSPQRLHYLHVCGWKHELFWRGLQVFRPKYLCQNALQEHVAARSDDVLEEAIAKDALELNNPIRNKRESEKSLTAFLDMIPKGSGLPSGVTKPLIVASMAFMPYVRPVDSLSGLNLRTCPPHVRSLVADALVVTVTVTTTVDADVAAGSKAKDSLDAKTMNHVYLPRWTVTNDSILDDPYVCHDITDCLAPPALFAQLRAMDYNQLYSEFNVGAAWQVCLGEEVRMQREHTLERKSEIEDKCAEHTTLLPEKDAEIAHLKSLLSLKETEAAEVISLGSQLSVMETTHAAKSTELRDLKEKNFDLEGKRNALSERVTALESLSRDELNSTVDSLESERDCLAAQKSSLEYAFELFRERIKALQDEQAKALGDRVADLDSQLSDMAIHLDEEFYPLFLTTISVQRWFLSHGLKLVILKCLQ
nr:reverse transcriptase domain-containing protein [Tanacetum cinerariifolium]